MLNVSLRRLRSHWLRFFILSISCATVKSSRVWIKGCNLHLAPPSFWIPQPSFLWYCNFGAPRQGFRGPAMGLSPQQLSAAVAGGSSILVWQSIHLW
jgi:hypothetical protein